MRRHYIRIFIASFFIKFSFAQAPLPVASSEIRLKMERLNVLGSALYFAAHPDDENTKLIAYLASERKVRTAYLSLTRGDGGQNLIGTEQGIELGLIRTQELLQARRIDGGEQYFASAYDFGFSKTFDETFRFWNKEEVLREAVWLIRKLQPDVIITRFPPDERGGHGHHQASAILAHEAFIAAADPKMFPEQLKEFPVWQARRILWNTANFMRMQGESNNQLKIDIGNFNPLLGRSYGEISAQSRSQHKSQGFGSAATNGRSIETFEYVDGEKATDDLFDGIDLSWSRLPGSQDIQNEVQHLILSFNDRQPQLSLPLLASIWKKLQAVEDGYWKSRKIAEVEQIMLDCAGIKLESTAPSSRFELGKTINFKTEIIVRNPAVNAILAKINDINLGKTLPYNETLTNETSIVYGTTTQPYWLSKPHSLGKFDVAQKYFGYPINPDLPMAAVQLEIEGVPVTVNQPIQYRYVDPVRGEVYEYIEVLPRLSVSTDTKNLLIPGGEKRSVQVTFQRSGTEPQNSSVSVKGGSKGYKVSPETIQLAFKNGETQITRTLEVSNNSATDDFNLSFSADGEILKNIREIAYDHIPRQAWFPDAGIKVRPITLQNSVKRVGYIMGAGDLVPESLRNLGIQVDLLPINRITEDLLNNYEAIVCGVRLMNVESGIAQALPLLNRYADGGGVVLMQYNVNTRLQQEHFAPSVFTLGRARVTEEDAKVVFRLPDDPALNYPNKITKTDFDGWIQERGLYFAEDIDPSYRTPLSMHDKNEPAHKGSLLIKKVGKGKFVYTSLSFFRQLPAGVPGATRLFVNLLAKEQ